MDDSATTEQSKIAETTATFAEGELGQIQGILFGDHARRVDDRLATLEAALLGAIADLRTEMRASIEALNGKLRSEETTRTKAVKNLGERIDTETDLRSEAESQLTHKIDSTESVLRTAISTERAELKAETERELDMLRNSSVDRKNLAELFSTTAERLLEE